MRAVAAAALLLVGCGPATSPSEPTPASAAPTSTPAPATPAPATPAPAPPDPSPGPAVEPGEDGPPMVVLPTGLSELYENFFRDGDALTAFSKRLGTVLDHDRPVTVEVNWSEERLEGVITLLVPDEDDVAAALADQIAAGGPVDPSSIQPLVGSVGAWRADLGNRFDLRLLSFTTRTVFWDHVSGSRCWVEGPMNDPAGTALPACFSCLPPGAGEERICRAGDAWPAPLDGSKRAVAMLSSALRPTK